MTSSKPVKVMAWAVMYESNYFNIFINAPARIYATRKSAYEFANGGKVIQVEIRPLKPRGKKK